MALNHAKLSDYKNKLSAVERLKSSSLIPGNNSIKIMLVDDSALMRNAISFILDAQSDFEIVERASNGQDALKKLKALPSPQQPDVVLTDIEMPHMDGITLLKHLKLKSTAKVIILSSKVVDKHSQEAKSARMYGASAIICKPSGAVSMDVEAKRGQDIISAIRRISK